MSKLVVQSGARLWRLEVRKAFVFGRDPGCDLVLDNADTGISRLAGRVFSLNGLWMVENTSRNRPLHVADTTGFVVPLPVALGDAAPILRAVDQVELTVLVPGDLHTHALALRPDPPMSHPTLGNAGGLPDLVGLSTRSVRPHLTDLAREAVVALAQGYLRRMPHYDPRPRTYAEAAEILAIRPSQVRKRIERVRTTLVEAGIRGLTDEKDSRQSLCVWLLATRQIVPEDLDWLHERLHN